MKKKLVIVVSVAFVLMIHSVVLAGQFDNILTAADVEKATGLTGIKKVPHDSSNKFLNGDINFVLKDGQPILMIQFRPLFIFDKYKEDPGYFKTPLTGIGEEAFTSPAFDPQFSINFRKNNHVAVVTTNIDPKDSKKTILSMEQLTTISKVLASKM